MTQVKLKIKKGDTVKVLSGKDKGKTGKVLRVFSTTRKVVVEDINLHSKFDKPRNVNRQRITQKITFPSAMSVSKVMLIDPNSGKPTRVGYEILENGTKQRIAKKSKKAV
jgi:large subunit ribosomal protein L24